MSTHPNSLAHEPDYRAFCQERLQNPYPLLHRLRSEDPVHWCEPMKLWLITRYDDVNNGLRDPRFSSNRMEMYVQALPPELKAKVQPLLAHLSKWIQFTDDPDHGRLRKLVNQAFTPKALNALRPQIGGLVNSFLENLPQNEPFDLIERFCALLPATVICEMMGVPVAERDRFRHATGRVFKFSSRAGPALAGFAADAHAAVEELMVMFEQLVEERRRAPRDDLLSALVSAEADGESLSNEELYAMCVFLFFAGYDTTTNGIANGLLALMTNPGQWAKLKSNPDALVADTVEEVLRYETPVPRAVRRTLEKVDISGRQIPAGAIVIFLLNAANRDPERFSHPDKFDVQRASNRHLAFGFGRHFCLGAMLARIEMEMAFRAVTHRFPGLRLAREDLSWRPVMGLRALESLPVTMAS